jgi:hypothetical protein
MLFLRFPSGWRCNAGAMLLALFLPVSAWAQSPAADPAEPNEHPIVDAAKFLAGVGGALVLHESGHLLFDAIFGADVQITGVHLGPVPFFAVAHRAGGVTPRQEFTISSAGFWTQEATAEWLLVHRPDLRHEHAPFAKGVFAFDVLTSVGYGTVAMFEAGPPERDTRGMTATGLNERFVGALVMAPALLDGYRYFNPDAAWAKWASRAVKIAGVLLVLKPR